MPKCAADPSARGEVAGIPRSAVVLPDDPQYPDMPDRPCTAGAPRHVDSLPHIPPVRRSTTIRPCQAPRPGSTGHDNLRLCHTPIIDAAEHAVRIWKLALQITTVKTTDSYRTARWPAGLPVFGSCYTGLDPAGRRTFIISSPVPEYQSLAQSLSPANRRLRLMSHLAGRDGRRSAPSPNMNRKIAVRRQWAMSLRMTSQA